MCGYSCRRPRYSCRDYEEAGRVVGMLLFNQETIWVTIDVYELLGPEQMRQACNAPDAEIVVGCDQLTYGAARVVREMRRTDPELFCLVGDTELLEDPRFKGIRERARMTLAVQDFSKGLQDLLPAAEQMRRAFAAVGQALQQTKGSTIGLGAVVEPFRVGDILCLSDGDGSVSSVVVTGVDSAGRITVKNVAWYRRAYWWMCRIWKETFPFLSSDFKPV